MPKKKKNKVVRKSKGGGTTLEPKLSYRFYDGPNEFGKQSHLHQVIRDPKVGWENLNGVSSITKVIAKPLTWWAAGETLKVLGWTNSKLRVNGRYQSVALESRLTHLKPFWEGIRTLDDLGVIKLLDTAYKAHDTRLDQTAEAGTDLHAELEKYVKVAMQLGIKEVKKEDWKFFDNEKIWQFHQYCLKTFKRFLWSETYGYDLDIWVGGQSDAGVETLKGEYGVVDFKSHESPYFSDWVQMGGYDLIISKNGGHTKDGKQQFVLEKPITKYFLIPFKAEDFVANIGVNSEVEALKRSFLAAATLYREKNKYEKY